MSLVNENQNCVGMFAVFNGGSLIIEDRQMKWIVHMDKN